MFQSGNNKTEQEDMEMEVEVSGTTAVASKSLQELAMDGQSVLEATVQAAHQTLASMNEVLCNPALWTTSPSTTSTTTTLSTATTTGGGSQSATAAAPANATDPQDSSTANKAEPAKTESPAQQEAGWAALDEARLRLRSSTAALRALITSIFIHPQMKEQEDPSGSPKDKSDPAEVEKIEHRAAELREEIMKKNKVMKALIDQFRELINDISMWQTPGL